MSSRKEHVFVEDQGKTLHCLHCGQRYEVNLPCPLEVYSAILKAFAKLHKPCREQLLEDDDGEAS